MVTANPWLYATSSIPLITDEKKCLLIKGTITPMVFVRLVRKLAAIDRRQYLETPMVSNVYRLRTPWFHSLQKPAAVQREGPDRARTKEYSLGTPSR